MPTPIRHLHLRRSCGAVSLSWLVLLLLLAIALSAVVYLAVNRGGNGNAIQAPQVLQAQIDEELSMLQQAFQTALQEKQDLARLAAQARAFTEQYPDQQGGYVLLAQTRMGLKQWDQAYAAWKNALANDTAGAFEMSKMAGLCAAKLGQTDQALSHYQQAVQATNDQADSEVYAALGQLHLALNDTTSAKEMFNRAVKAHGPGEKTNYKHAAYAGLADVASVNKNIDSALAWADRAIKMAKLDSDADSAAYHIQKARLYMDANRDQDAVTMLGYTWSQFASAPWRIESARLRAKLHERNGQLDKAVDYIQAITEYHSQAEARDQETLANFTALLTQWQIKAGRLEAAKVSLHNLQTIMPTHPAIDELKTELQ